MITNQELYGREVPRVPETVCNFRLQLLKERLKVLLDVHYTEHDTQLINHVQKAIAFWIKMRDGEENE